MLVAGTSAVGVTATYLTVLTVAAHGRRPVGPVVTSGGERTRFVVLIPAHDEEIVIGRALEALSRQEYSSDHFAVHVVADNCDDRTADIVRSHGVCVHERVDRERPGKGPALNWLLERLVSAGEHFDAVVIIDADTSVHPAFLRHMDARDPARCEGGPRLLPRCTTREHRRAPACVTPRSHAGITYDRSDARDSGDRAACTATEWSSRRR